MPSLQTSKGLGSITVGDGLTTIVSVIFSASTQFGGNGFVTDIISTSVSVAKLGKVKV